MFEVTSPSEIFTILAKATKELLAFQGALNEQTRLGKVDVEHHHDGIQGFWDIHKEALGLFQGFRKDLPEATVVSDEIQLHLKNYYNQIDQTELIIERAQTTAQFEKQQSELCLSLNINVNAETSEKSTLKQIQQGIVQKLRLQLNRENIDNQYYAEAVEHLNAIFDAMIAIKTKSPKELKGEGIEKYRLLLAKVQERLAMLIEKLHPDYQQETNYIEAFSDVVEQFAEDAEESGLSLNSDMTISEQMLEERKQRARQLFQQSAKSSAALDQQKRKRRPPAIQSNRRTVNFE